MTGTQVFDRLARGSGASAGRAPESGDLTRLAGQLVASSIQTGRMLRELRGRLFPVDGGAEAAGVAFALRAELQQWAQEAQAVLERAADLRRAGQAISGTRELGDLIGATLAMLQITPEAHARALEQVRRGETTPLDEVRRELQLKFGR